MQIVNALADAREGWAIAFLRHRVDRNVTSDRQAIARADVEYGARITTLEGELEVAKRQL